MKRYEYLIVSDVGAFPLFFHRSSFHLYFYEVIKSKERAPTHDRFEDTKMKQLQHLCQLICISAHSSEGIEPLQITLSGFTYFIVPHLIKTSLTEKAAEYLVFSCLILFDDPNNIHVKRYFDFGFLISSFLFQQFLHNVTEDKLLHCLEDLVVSQQRALKESTLNDSTGSYYDEQNLEQLWTQYEIDDSIQGFEDNWMSIDTPIQELLMLLTTQHPCFALVTVYLKAKERALLLHQCQNCRLHKISNEDIHSSISPSSIYTEQEILDLSEIASIAWKRLRDYHQLATLHYIPNTNFVFQIHCFQEDVSVEISNQCSAALNEWLLKLNQLFQLPTKQQQ